MSSGIATVACPSRSLERPEPWTFFQRERELRETVAIKQPVPFPVSPEAARRIIADRVVSEGRALLARRLEDQSRTRARVSINSPVPLFDPIRMVAVASRAAAARLLEPQ
jgi:hypothetical protein